MISHGRLAFCTATMVLLAFISGAAGSTDTTSRKPDNEEKMVWKVTISSALIFFCKDICTIKVTFLTLICICNRVRSVSFKTVGRVIDPHIERSNVSCVLFPWLRAGVSGKRS